MTDASTSSFFHPSGIKSIRFTSLACLSSLNIETTTEKEICMSSRSVNKVIVLGHLGRDAETAFTQSGVAVTKFSVATSRRWKDSQSDEWKEETDWHNVVLWRSENLSSYLTKGKQVYVEGRLQTRSYEDRDGAKRYVTEIVADNVILLGGQQGGSQDQPASSKGNSAGLVSQPRGRTALASAPPADPSSGPVTDADVPF